MKVHVYIINSSSIISSIKANRQWILHPGPKKENHLDRVGARDFGRGYFQCRGKLSKQNLKKQTENNKNGIFWDYPN